MTDILGKIIRKQRYLRLIVVGKVSTLYNKLAFTIKGVQYGKGLLCWANTYVVRHPNSKIIIADHVAFRSDKKSNPIGIRGNCILSTHSNTALLQIGQGSGFSGTSIGAMEKIIIGNDVFCGANTLITDFDWHGIQPDQRKTSNGESKPVIIGNNVFIGYGSVILKGVTIGDNSVIGANSVVTRSIPANVIAGGNPCKVIKNL